MARRSACRSLSAKQLPYDPVVADPQSLGARAFQAGGYRSAENLALRGVIVRRVPGVRTARKLLAGLGIGLAFISICSVFVLVYLSRLNAVVRHLAFDPVPGAAAIASVAKDFNEYRVLDASSRSAAKPQTPALIRKAADIERDLKAYDVTITQADDRQRFTELVALWSTYRGLQGETASLTEPPPPGSGALERQEKASAAINALLATMIDWNGLEGVRSIVTADSATQAASVTCSPCSSRRCSLVHPGALLQPDCRAADERAG